MHMYRRCLWALTLLTLGVSALFIAFPGVDIAVSALFYGESGFWLHEIKALQILRLGLLALMDGFGFMVLIGFARSLWRGQGQDRCRWGFALAGILLGPLLLVNGVFKTFWGRARPVDILAFGGDKTFSPAWVISDQCDFNCSFTSGEGGAMATMALLVVFLAWPHLGRRGRLGLSAAMAALTVLTAGLRVAVGRHFLSDTLLSVLLCALVLALLYPLFFAPRKRLNKRR